MLPYAQVLSTVDVDPKGKFSATDPMDGLVDRHEGSFGAFGGFRSAAGS
jgi:hypothetical protein